MRWVRLRRTALRANPQMNTSTQPPEGAGRSRSKAAGELTLGLLSGEGRVCAAPLWEILWLRGSPQLAFGWYSLCPTCRSEACPRRRPDSRPIYGGCIQIYVAAEGCDLLILKINVKRSQPSAAPTESSVRRGLLGEFNYLPRFTF